MAPRRYALILLALVAQGGVVREGARAQNPDGFLQGTLWACMLPLDGNDCSGGGERAMLGSWVAPHDVATESPVVGTIWSDIDFGRTAKSGGWLGRGTPRFVRIGSGPDPNLVDLARYLATGDLPASFVLAIAVTYVRNTTESPLPVHICTASDDSIQVWVNNGLVLNQSICRAVAPSCSELTPAVLAPGVNRLTVLVWQGIGGFGFRLGLSRSDGTPYTERDSEIEYLGAREDPGALPQLPLLTRTWTGSEFLCPGESHEVRISGNGRFIPTATYRVCEELRGRVTPDDVGSTTTGSSITALPSEVARAGRFHHGVVGTPCAADNRTTVDGDIYTTHARTGGDIWAAGDTFEFAYLSADGDFDVAVEIVDRRFPAQGRWGKFGLMARKSLAADSRHGMIQDHGPDLQDPARFARRRVDGDVGSTEESATTEEMVDPNDGSSLRHPRFLRLTRRGSVVTGWASQTAGLEGFDAWDDRNWAEVYADDWAAAGGANVPEVLLVGFAYSVHESSGCLSGEIDWRPLTLQVDEVPQASAGVRLCWDAPGSLLDDGGILYTATLSRGEELRVSGYCEGATNQGPRKMYFQLRGSGPLGFFDRSDDIGIAGPCTPGSLTIDDGGTTEPGDDRYTLTASGKDIWTEGDQFTFAYRKVQGDFDVRARVLGVSHPPAGSRWGKYGLMARWDCRPDAPYFFVHDCSATDEVCEIDGPRTACRPSPGTPGDNREQAWVWWQDVLGTQRILPRCEPMNEDPRANDARGDGRNAAPFLRLVRRGNAFYGYGSSDGKDWRALGSFSWVEAPPSTLVGIAATSHAECNALGVDFGELTIGKPSEPAVAPDGEAGIVVARDSFDGAEDGSSPEGWVTSRWGSGSFTPQVAEGRLRLADIVGSPRGSGEDTATAAFLDETFDPAGTYVFEFDAYFHYDSAAAGDGNPPADGLTFCALGTRTGTRDVALRLGDPGGGLGYQRINMSRDESRLRSVDSSVGSFAVELDIWHNGDAGNEGDGTNVSGWDPAGGAAESGTGRYHVGLDVNASTSSVQRNHQLGIRDEDLPDIFDPHGVHVRIRHEPGRIRAWLKARAPGAGEEIQVLDGRIEPIDRDSEGLIVGFTAATGTATCTIEVDDFTVSSIQPDVTFHRGDSNVDGRIDIADGIFVLNFLFIGGPVSRCMEAANPNDDGTVNITDGIYMLNFLFLGGPAPSPPGIPPAACGPDPATGQHLGCESYPHCR